GWTTRTPGRVTAARRWRRRSRDRPALRLRSGSEGAERVVDEDADFVARGVVVAGVVGDAQCRCAQADIQVLGRAALHGVRQLVEELAFLAVAGGAGIDVAAAHVGDAIAQAREAVLGEVD